MPSPDSGRSMTLERSTSRFSLESAQKYVEIETASTTTTRVSAPSLIRRRQSGAGRPWT